MRRDKKTKVREGMLLTSFRTILGPLKQIENCLAVLVLFQKQLKFRSLKDFFKEEVTPDLTLMKNKEDPNKQSEYLYT